MKTTLVQGEKNAPNRDALRKSLFGTQPEIMQREEPSRMVEKKNKEEESVDHVSNLMNSLEKVRVESGDNIDRETTTDQRMHGSRVTVETTHEDHQKRQPVKQNILGPNANILHPTTKTITSKPTTILPKSTKKPLDTTHHNTEPIKTKIPPPPATKNDTTPIATTHTKPHQNQKPNHPITTDDLTPLATIVKIVKTNNPMPNIHHTDHNSPPIPTPVTTIPTSQTPQNLSLQNQLNPKCGIDFH